MQFPPRSSLLCCCVLLGACGGGSSGSSSSGSGGGAQNQQLDFVENFATTQFLDASRSVAGLWVGDGVLDSGLDPVTGLHRGGGPGVLGPWRLDGLTLNTDQQQVPSELLGRSVTVNGGVFPVISASLGSGSRATALGSAPLRLLARGELQLAGELDLSGENAPVNFALARPQDERIDYSGFGLSEPSAAMQAWMADPLEAAGGDGGLGQLAAGDGGVGGADWYALTGFYDDSKDGWYAYQTGQVAAADPSRFQLGWGDVSAGQVHGGNGGGVGGASPQGAPLPAAAAALLAADQQLGSGQGSWAWPPKSGRFPLESEVLAGTWSDTTNGLDLVAYHYSGFLLESFARARARGGGGGGYWLPGERGDVHREGGFDALGDSLPTPDLTPSYSGWKPGQNWDFNGEVRSDFDAQSQADRLAWPSFLAWDQLAGGQLADGAGSQLVAGTSPWYRLNPAQGQLRGGAGGGGAGSAQHGSLNFLGTLDEMESYRGCDGGGGGAGGGAAQLQAGGALVLDGTIDVRGGDGGSAAAAISSSYAIDPAAFEFTLPGGAGGGGGSGGALLLQSEQISFGPSAQLQLDGGAGGVGAVGNDGGAGGAGLLRLESAQAWSLATLQNVVSPVAAADLAARPEWGLNGVNAGSFRTELPGAVGDLIVPREVGSGTISFNGNSSGVASSWYETGAEVTVIGWEVVVLWQDGVGGGGTLRWSDERPTTPGLDPIWFAWQTSAQAQPESSSRPWWMPGYNTVAGGVEEGATQGLRAFRWQLVFDQDRVRQFIGSAPNARLQVESVRIRTERTSS